MLKGTYLVGRKLAGGGMGVIYDASHVRLPRRYAIKVLTAELSGNEQAVGRFRREAEIVAGLGHPNIVDVVDFDQLETGELYMVMELLQGEDLAARLQRGPIDLASTVRMFRDVCGALDVAHHAGIVHRDLKPANLFLIGRDGRDDFVKILDFGISKVAAETTKLTADRAIMGTPCYMSPEQAQGDTQAIDRRTDVFALGAILYECLTGQTAFGGDSLLAILHKITRPERPRLLALRPDLPGALEVVVQRAIALGRDDRFLSAGELYRALSESSGVPFLPLSGVMPAQAGVVSGQGWPSGAGSVPPSGQAWVSAQPSAQAFHVSGPATGPTGPSAQAQPVKPTTLSSAAGQASSTAPMTGAPRSKKKVAGAIAVVGALAFAGILIAVLKGGGGKNQPEPAPTVEAATQPAATPAAEAPLVSFEIRSTPTGATVLIDGEKIGETPTTASVTPGKHSIEVTHTGHVSAKTEIDVASGIGFFLVSLAKDDCKTKPPVAATTPSRPGPPAATPREPEPSREPDPPKMSYEDAISEARAKLKSADYTDALRAAEAALRAKPGDPDAAMTATVAACGQGSRSKAQQHLPKSRGSYRDIALQRCGSMGVQLDP
jgi:serine/threonine-protein kinase